VSFASYSSSPPSKPQIPVAPKTSEYRISLVRFVSSGAAARAADEFGDISMKRILGGMVVAAALSGSAVSGQALAADLPPRGYNKAPAMAAPVTNWSGLYVGGNVGYGWGNANTAFSFLPTPTFFEDNTALDTKSKGVIGGAQLGYSWQMGAIVAGLETDIQGSGIKGSRRSPFFDTDAGAFVPGEFLSTEQKLSWFGTVRGRLGATVTPDLLLYATGGLAYGHVDASANTFFDSANQYPASVSQTKAGWTAGAGAEWMFARNWSAKVEYLYLDLGNVSAIGHSASAPNLAVAYTWKTQENIVRAGVNYHF
jgi:outer membrane immunogenic protein